MKSQKTPLSMAEEIQQLDSEPTIIIAMPTMTDPNFEKTVIILIEHTKEGATGFIVNRPTETPLHSLILENQIDIPDSIPAWFGGPAATDNGLVLHNQGEPGSAPGNICISASDLALEGLVDHANEHSANKDKDKDKDNDLLYPYRFLVGYAGWGPNQLEEEMKQGAWLQIPMNLKLVFNTPWDQMWKLSTASLGIAPTKLTPMHHDYLI